MERAAANNERIARENQQMLDIIAKLQHATKKETAFQHAVHRLARQETAKDLAVAAQEEQGMHADAEVDHKTEEPPPRILRRRVTFCENGVMLASTAEELEVPRMSLEEADAAAAAAVAARNVKAEAKRQKQRASASSSSTRPRKPHRNDDDTDEDSAAEQVMGSLEMGQIYSDGKEMVGQAKTTNEEHSVVERASVILRSAPSKRPMLRPVTTVAPVDHPSDADV